MTEMPPPLPGIPVVPVEDAKPAVAKPAAEAAVAVESAPPPPPPPPAAAAAPATVTVVVSYQAEWGDEIDGEVRALPVDIGEDGIGTAEFLVTHFAQTDPNRPAVNSDQAEAAPYPLTLTVEIRYRDRHDRIDVGREERVLPVVDGRVEFVLTHMARMS